MSQVTTRNVKVFLANSYLKAKSLKSLWELQPPTKGSTVQKPWGLRPSPTGFNDPWKVEAACVPGSQGLQAVYTGTLLGKTGSSVCYFVAWGTLDHVYLK